jgi:predicted ester cyclase
MVAVHRSRDELVAGLVRIGELEMTGKQQDEIDAYFAPDFVFHDTDGSTMSYDDLNAYFASLRAAFDNLKITRGITVVEGDFISCQTTIEGDFVRTFTHSPVGTLEPNGAHVVFALHNFFRYDEQGRLVEEWIQSDRRATLTQLGAEGR